MNNNHSHNGIDTPKLYANDCLENAPQEALTTKNTNTLSTGGTEDLKSSDSLILDNLILRVDELEIKLKNLGLLK